MSVLYVRWPSLTVASYTSNPTPLHSQRDSQDRGSSSPNNPYFSRSSTASSDPESLPRGRARRRDDHVVDGSPTVRKGAFRLHKYRRPDEFCFPKSRSQPEPIWRPGDGFSDEEARTPMMLKRKRKRSHSLTGLGQLPLESKSTGEDNIESTGLSQRKAREKPRELWPTRDNFLEIPILKKIRKDAVESSVAEPTTVPTTINQTTSKSRGKQVVPRKRQISDFENFGRRRRKSQSRPRRTPSSSFMGIQRNIVQTSHDSACAEDYNSSSEQAGDGHTERYATSEEPDYIFEMSGSLELGGEADSWDLLIDESDDSDGSADPDTDATEDRIQGTVPDSQVEFD